MHQTTAATSGTALVPPRRLGSLLSEARASRGSTLEELAEASRGQFSTARLSSIETGSVTLDDAQLASLATLYGMNTTELVPNRSKLFVDLTEGVVNVDGRRTDLPPAAGRDEVLGSYLGLVYSMRELDRGTKLTLRAEDLDVLGRVLDLGPSTVEANLVSLMRDLEASPTWRERLLQPRVLLPAAGILVAFCAVGALLLVPGDPGPSNSVGLTVPVRTEAPAAAPVPVDIGTAVVQERDAAGNPGPIQPRTGEPTPGGDVQIDTPAVVERDAPIAPAPSIGSGVVIERENPDTGSGVNPPTI